MGVQLVNKTQKELQVKELTEAVLLVKNSNFLAELLSGLHSRAVE